MRLFRPITPLLAIALTCLGGSTLCPKSVAAAQPRVAVLSVPNATPPAKNVVHVIAEQLFELDIAIEIVGATTQPKTPTAWIQQGEKAAEEAPGTIALFGYQCDDTVCRLFIVEPRQKAFVEIPVKIPTHDELSASFALAATARESLLGPLFPELRRLVLQGKNPAPPPPSPESQWLKPPMEGKRKTLKTPARPWLWLETGYQGDHPHPEGKPVHGPWIGAVFEPRKSVGVHVSLGWLGIREREIGSGKITLNRLTSTVGVRIIFPLGPAHIALAPTARLDTVFANIDRTGGSETTDVKLEIQAGGVTTWHLPLTSRVEVIVGAGVFASLLSHDYGIKTEYKSTERVIPASTLHLFWVAGVAWSPL